MKKILLPLFVAATLIACNNNTNNENPSEEETEMETIYVEEVDTGLKKEATSGLDSESVLYLLDGEKVDKETIKALDANAIERVDIYKDADKLKEYGAESFDGVVVVTLK